MEISDSRSYTDPIMVFSTMSAAIDMGMSRAAKPVVALPRVLRTYVTP
jgi:hypothetical protein